MTGDGTASAQVDERLRSLYAATQELMTATTRESLSTVVVDASRRVLGYTMTGVHLRPSAGAERLEPTAWTSEAAAQFDEQPPTYTPGDRAYDVFDREDPCRLRDLPSRPADPDHGVVVPIEGHGVLVAGTDDGDPPDEVSVDLIELLADNTAVALDRLETSWTRVTPPASRLPRRTRHTRCSGSD